MVKYLVVKPLLLGPPHCRGINTVSLTPADLSRDPALATSRSASVPAEGGGTAGEQE